METLTKRREAASPCPLVPEPLAPSCGGLRSRPRLPLPGLLLCSMPPGSPIHPDLPDAPLPACRAGFLPWLLGNLSSFVCTWVSLAEDEFWGQDQGPPTAPTAAQHGPHCVFECLTRCYCPSLSTWQGPTSSHSSQVRGTWHGAFFLFRWLNLVSVSALHSPRPQTHNGTYFWGFSVDLKPPPLPCGVHCCVRTQMT